MRIIILLICLISFSAYGQSTNVKVWDGTRISTVRDTGSSDSLNVAIVDGSGNQITSFGGAGGTSSNFTSAFPSAGTASGFSDGTNMQGGRVYDTDSGAGTQYTLGCSIRGSGSGGSVELGSSTNPIRTDPTGTTTQPVSDAGGSLTVDGTITCNAGTGPFPVSDNGGSLTVDGTVAATQSGAWAVSVNNASGASAVNIQDGGNSITVDGTVTVTDGAGALNVIVDSGTLTAVTSITNALPAGNNNIGDVDIASIAGVLSTNNSSTATLGGGAAFTGTADDVTNYAWIQVSVFSNVTSATDGLSLQQSSNGTNWDITDTYTITAATGKVFSVQPGARFFRIVYTNGAGAQASFRLQTIYKYTASKSSSQRAQDGQSNETDLEQDQSFLMGFNGTTWDRLRTLGTGLLNIVNSASVGTGYDKYSFGALVGTVQTIKGTAATLGGYYLFNPAATACYIQMFDVATATTVTLGTTVPDQSLGIPAGSAANIPPVSPGVNWVNGIKIASTTTRLGSTPCGTGSDVNFWYK